MFQVRNKLLLNGYWEHYGKWNKSDRERQILYDCTYMWNLKKWTHKAEQIGGCHMGGAGGEEVKEAKDTHFQTKDKFWGSNVQYDDCS